MNRRTFLCSTGITALGSLLPDLAFTEEPNDGVPEQKPFEWTTPELTFAFELSGQRLRQKSLMPNGASQKTPATRSSSGVETAIQCSGENSPDAGMKQSAGQPGVRLLFKGKREVSTTHGRLLVLSQSDPTLGIEVDSFY